MSAVQRTIATVLAEIAEVRRHVHETPPHHGGGREALESRLSRLEAELARLRTTGPSVRADGSEPPRAG